MGRSHLHVGELMATVAVGAAGWSLLALAVLRLAGLRAAGCG